MEFLENARKDLKSIEKNGKQFKELVEGKSMSSVSFYMFICQTEYQINTFKYFVELQKDYQDMYLSAFSKIIQRIQKQNPDQKQTILELEIFAETLRKKTVNGEKGEGDEIEDENKGEDESKNEKFKQQQIDQTFGPFLRDQLKQLVKQILTIKQEQDKKRTNDLKSELKSEDIIKNQQYAVTDLTGRDNKSSKQSKLQQLITDLTGIIDLFKQQVQSVNRKTGEIEKLFIDEKGNNKVAEILNNLRKLVSQPILNVINTISIPTVIAGGILGEVRAFRTFRDSNNSNTAETDINDSSAAKDDSNNSYTLEIIVYATFVFICALLILELIKANGGWKESCEKIFKYLKQFCSSCCCFSCCKEIKFKECCGKLCEGFKNWWNRSPSEQKSIQRQLKERNTSNERQNYSIDDQIINSSKSPNINQSLVSNQI